MAKTRPPKNASIFGQLEGAEELLASMARLPAAVERQVMRPALREGAKVAMKEIKSRAPREDGDLYKSFKVRAIPRSRTKIGARVIVDRKSLHMHQQEGFYAAMQELGWRPGRRGSNRGNAPVKGRRYMREGLYQSQPEVRAKIISEARRRLPGAVARLSRKIDMKAIAQREQT